MNAYTTEILLDATQFGVPSGNYDGSSLDWAGNAKPAANYYGGPNSIQTLTVDVANFQGVIHIEATLQDPNHDAAYVRIEEYSSLLSPSTTVATFTNIGNYVWLRARVLDFSAGTINSVTANY